MLMLQSQFWAKVCNGMLKIINSLAQLDVAAFMEIYGYSDGGRAAIQEQYSFLADFFRERGSYIAIWEVCGTYACALRMEPYLDGHLISGMETHPRVRNQGYCTQLLKALLDSSDLGLERIYSHVAKNNLPSLAVHKKTGFTVQKEYGVLLDGTVSHNYFTLVKQI